jgi:hypothetical protein
MTTANPVVDALEEVLGTEESGVAPTDELSPEVTPEEAALDTKVPGTTEKSGAKDAAGKTVPYDRFSEVVKAKNEAIAKVESLEGQFDGAKEREDSLRTRVGALENDHQILEAIKALAGDERYRDHVIAIDKAIQGIEDEVEVAEEAGDNSALLAAQKQLESKAAELETLVAHQKADSLWEMSDKMATQMIDALPEEYNDEDKALLSKLWTPTVNWDGIEEEGREAIQPELQTTFAQLIKNYGTPRGALIRQVQQEVERDTPEANASPEEMVDSVLETDWSARDEDGKAEHSDDDFTKMMAEVIRKTRQT